MTRSRTLSSAPPMMMTVPSATGSAAPSGMLRQRIADPIDRERVESWRRPTSSSRRDGCRLADRWCATAPIGAEMPPRVAVSGCGSRRDPASRRTPGSPGPLFEKPESSPELAHAMPANIGLAYAAARSRVDSTDRPASRLHREAPAHPRCRVVGAVAGLVGRDRAGAGREQGHAVAADGADGSGRRREGDGEAGRGGGADGERRLGHGLVRDCAEGDRLVDLADREAPADLGAGL